MNFNEIAYLYLGLVCGIFFSWLYLKYQMRNFPSFKELISEQGKTAEKTMELLKEQRKDLDKRITNKVFSVLIPQNSIKSKNSIGGVSSETVKKTIKMSKKKYL